MLPTGFDIFVVALFGLVIGSFLNVVIYRLHTGRSLNDRSHCLSCGHQLQWFELFPVVSYLVLRGRCRSCSSFIPYRYALVELVTALAFVMAWLSANSLIHFGLLSVLLSILIVGLVYDLYHMIIPDEVSYGALIVATVIVLMGESLLLDAILGAVAAFLAYASLWYFSKGQAFGFGDAKLAVPLGALVGIERVFSLVALSFWVGTVIALSWIVLNIGRRKLVSSRVTIKSEIPFAPFLIMAFVLVYFFDIRVLELIETLYASF